MDAKRPRIFIGLNEIAGYCQNLQSGFIEAGCKCMFVNLSDHQFQYSTVVNPYRVVRVLKWCLQQRRSTQRRQLIRKLFWIGLTSILRLVLFCWAIFKYDAFIFVSNTSLFGNYWDLPLLRLLRKKIIYIYLGTDSRPPYLNGALLLNEDFARLTTDNQLEAKIILKPAEIIKLTRAKKKAIGIMERYANVVINYPPQAYFHEKQFVLGLIVGLPHQPNAELVKSAPLTGETIRIIHAPSRPASKGTPLIRQAIANLELKGYPIEFIEITGQPNALVLKELQGCDFVVDEVYSDSPLGVLGTEAAVYGKPVVVGGYYSEIIKQDLAADQIPPSYYCSPEEIESAIEKLILDRAFRIKLGKAAQNFVQKYYAPAQVAERYLLILNDMIPRDWFYDPQKINYLFGYGLSKIMLKKVLRTIYDLAGKDALQLADKPQLEQAFLKFINS